MNATSTIDSLLEAAVASGRFLGISYIAADVTGRRIYCSAFGHANFARSQPMTVDTAGWLASMSKLMTCVAVMHAVDHGLLGLDDDLAEILPELRGKEILVSSADATGDFQFAKSTEPITLRRALSHSSGLAYPPCDPTLDRWATAKGHTMAEFYGDFRRDWDRPMVSEPGVSWCYSPGIDWAGRALEKASDQSLEDYMRENIWTPLGMNRTTFHPEEHTEHTMLSMGTRVDGPGSVLKPADGPYPIPAKDCAGGAGIYSTANDYMKLLVALLQDRNLIVTEASTKELLKPQLTRASRAALKSCRDNGMVLPEIPGNIPVDHSLGGLYIEVDVPGRRSRGSVCWDGMCSPHWLLDREAGVAVVLFVQIMQTDEDTRALWWELEREVYGLAAATKAGCDEEGKRVHVDEYKLVDGAHEVLIQS